jgi:hypothetical protein
VHFTVTGAGHAPRPSHVAASVAWPAAHDAARQLTVSPVKPVHVVRSIPSHFAAAHTSPFPPAHAGRAPMGAPTIGVQVPSVPIALHASHWPPQPALQQTPSVQMLLTH